MYKAVLWDFGGVITTSPFEAFSRFESENSLPVDLIRSINATNPDTNAWAQLESSEISLEEFDVKFAEEALARGYKISGQQVLALLSGSIRPAMVKALRLIKAKMKIGCITNNIKNTSQVSDTPNANDKAIQVAEVMSLFDSVIESSKAGIRKPNPRIYQIACETMGVKPEEAVFLDDLGINLKPARALGMTTIKVLSENQALAELESCLDMSLR